MTLKINLSSVSSQQTFECVLMYFVEEYDSIIAFVRTKKGGWNRAKLLITGQGWQLGNRVIDHRFSGGKYLDKWSKIILRINKCKTQRTVVVV